MRLETGVEQFFYRRKPASFQTLRSRFFVMPGAANAAGNPPSPIGFHGLRRGHADADVMLAPIGRGFRMCHVDARVDRRHRDRVAMHDARFDTSMRGAKCVGLRERLRCARARAKCAAYRSSCASDASTRATNARVSLASQCSSREISHALSHPRIVFSRRAIARTRIDARIGIDIDHRASRMQATLARVMTCCHEPA